MILKDPKTFKTKKIFFFNKFLLFYFISTILAGFVILVFVLTSTAFNKKINNFLDHFSKAGRFEYLYIFDIGWDALKSNFYSLKRIDLEINFEDILTLENFREKAIRNETLGNSEEIPRIKGSLIFDNEKKEAELRLKGERKIHFEEKKKSSYKIDLRRNNYILGLKRFSLQKPRVRNYIHEWLLHEISGELGLIKLKYEFVKFYINGTSQGLYVLEETFGKELIERNERRNGPIFAFDDNMVNFSTKFKVDEDDPFFEIYNDKYWNKEENIFLLRSASKKLRDFIVGERKLEETFDLELFAKFFAVIDLTYTYHALSPGTLRLYYNPINGLFEPIPFDGQRSNPNYHKHNSSFDNEILLDKSSIWWVKKFFYNNNEELNKDFYNKYLVNIKKLSSDNFLKKFLKKKKKPIKKINSFIYADYFFYANGLNFGPGLYYFSKNDLFYRAKILQERINGLGKNVQMIKKNDSEYLVKIFSKNCIKCEQNTFLTKISIKNIVCYKDGNIYKKKINIPVNKQLHFNKDTLIKIDKKENDLSCESFVFYDAIEEKEFEKKINDLNSFHNSNYAENVNKNLFYKYFSKKNNDLYLKNENTIINENLFIPKNNKIIIKPGQKIILTNGAFIISNSPWEVGGGQDKSIITGLNQNFGGGILITDVEEKSFFNNVSFANLSGLNINEKNLNKELIILGSLNFNNTSVDFNNVNIDSIKSEDAINIIRSNFNINNIQFSENVSDAIDIDFGEGKIQNTSFKNINNDAIDAAGSKIEIKNIYFNNIGDKLISAGENSKLDINKISADKSHVGIASKDGSTVNASNIKMNYVNIPFAAYRKKNEYGHGIMNVKKLNLENFIVNSIKDEKSQININGILYGKNTNNIIPIIYEKKIDLLN